MVRVPELAEHLKWLTPEQRLYSLQMLPAHLADIDDRERFQHLLMDFHFIESKLDVFGLEPLIEDYDLSPRGHLAPQIQTEDGSIGQVANRHTRNEVRIAVPPWRMIESAQYL